MKEQLSFTLPPKKEPAAPLPSTQLAGHGNSEGLLQLQKPSIPRAIFWAAIWLYVCWLIHKRWLPPMPPFETIAGFDNRPALRFKFFESGWIPFAITMTFFIGLHYLWQIVAKLLFPLSLANSLANQVDSPIIAAARRDNYYDLIKLLNQQITTGQLGYYSKRFAKLLHRWERDKDIGAVIALKNEVLESDEEDVALAFTAISWVEWALPLWGFLGTVVGIGNAIGSVKNGVNLLFERGKLDPAALGLFGEGFKGMAQAFDTTFQGLLFLIIVGGLHFMLRKSLASSLAQARVEFANFVAKWVGAGGDPPIINVHNFDIQMVQLDERMSQLQEAMEANDRRATEFREDVRSIVERVVAESPNLDWVRKVLFAPVIEFNKVWLNLAKQAVASINTKLTHNNWKFTALGVATFGSHRFVAAVEDKTKPEAFWLFCSDLDTETDSEQTSKGQEAVIQTKLKIKDLYLASSFAPQSLLVTTQTGELVLISTQAASKDKVIANNLQIEDAVFPAVIEKEDLALIVRRKPSGFDISYSDFAAGQSPKTIHQLPGNTSRVLWAFHFPSTTVLAATQNQRHWRLYLLQFSPPPPVPGETDTPTAPQPKLVCHQSERELPVRLKPRQLISLSVDEIVIVDEEGYLHYWHKTRPAPIKLNHASWLPDSKSRMLAGADGWIAVAANGHLTMWRIQRGGHLYPYEKKPEGFAIFGVDINSLVVSWDGRYVLAVEEKLVSIWEFPRYAVDELK